jgi:CubicO group peptidase (beta-lactamase class C family)
MGGILVARANQVIFSKGYGSADLEWDVPNSPYTKFRLGSVTKQCRSGIDSAARRARQAKA